MASGQVSAELPGWQYVPAKEFNCEVGYWIGVEIGAEPAALFVGETQILASAKVNYDTKSNHDVQIGFDLLKPDYNYGWGVDESGLGIFAKVGENGDPTEISSINQEYVEMPTDIYRRFSVDLSLAANPNATDGQLHIMLVDNTTGDKEGLVLRGGYVKLQN